MDAGEVSFEEGLGVNLFVLAGGDDVGVMLAPLRPSMCYGEQIWRWRVDIWLDNLHT